MNAFSPHPLSAIAVSPPDDAHRTYLAVCSEPAGTLCVLPMPALSAAQSYITPPAQCAELPVPGAAAASWDGTRTLYVADSRGSLNVYACGDEAPALRAQTVAAHGGKALNDVAATPLLVATAGRDALVKVWDPARATCTARLKGHKGEVRAVAVGAIDEHAHLLATAGRDRTVRVWDVRLGGAAGSSAAQVASFAGHEGWVHDVALCAGGAPCVVSASGDKTVRVWDLVAMRPRRVLADHTFRVWAVAAHPQGHFAVSASNDATLRLWRLDEDGEEADHQVWDAHGDGVRAVCVTRDARIVVSAAENGTVIAWDVRRMVGGEQHAVGKLVDVETPPPPPPTASANALHVPPRPPRFVADQAVPPLGSPHPPLAASHITVPNEPTLHSLLDEQPPPLSTNVHEDERRSVSSQGAPPSDTPELKRIRSLESILAARDDELATREGRLRELERAMEARDRELDLLRRQVVGAQNLAAHANARAFSVQSSKAPAAAPALTVGKQTTGNDKVDYGGAIGRIERVTGRLRSLAAKLDRLGGE